MRTFQPGKGLGDNPRRTVVATTAYVEANTLPLRDAGLTLRFLLELLRYRVTGSLQARDSRSFIPSRVCP